MSDNHTPTAGGGEVEAQIAEAMRGVPLIRCQRRRPFGPETPCVCADGCAFDRDDFTPAAEYDTGRPGLDDHIRATVAETTLAEKVREWWLREDGVPLDRAADQGVGRAVRLRAVLDAHDTGTSDTP